MTVRYALDQGDQDPEQEDVDIVEWDGVVHDHGAGINDDE